MNKKKKEKKVKITDLVFQRDITRYLIRHWLSDLSSTQAIVLLMIADRTFQWGQEDEAIPVRHFTEGITRKGEIVHAGLRVSDKTVRDAIKELEKREMVKVIHQTNGNPNYYAINLEWEPEHLKNKPKPIALPKPKKVQIRRSKIPTSEVETTGTMTVKSTELLKGRKDKRENLKREQIDAAEGDTEPQSKFEKEEEIKSDQKKRRKEKLQITNLRSSDLSRFWRNTILEYNEDARVGELTTIERKTMSKKQTWFKKAVNGEFTFSQFIQWTIENWDQLMAEQFNWMVDKPTIPNAQFFLNQFSKIYHRFEEQDRKWDEILSDKPTNDRQQKKIEKLEKELNIERGKVAVLKDQNKRVSKTKKVIDILPEDMTGEMNMHEWRDDDD